MTQNHDNEDQAWLDYKTKFSEIYDQSNYVSPLQAFVMRQSHTILEKKFTKQFHFDRILEIGAGTGEHVKFVSHKFDEYILTDLDQNMLDRARKKLGSAEYYGLLKFDRQEGSKLCYQDNSFDRLIAAHVLEHIYQPHLVLKEWIRVIKNGGILSILLPTDPGIAWRVGRCLGPRKNAIAQGIEYDYIMAREHVNSCNNLVAILRHYFKVTDEFWWPFSIPLMDFNLFFAFHAKIIK